jgi:hypothetical protein
MVGNVLVIVIVTVTHAWIIHSLMKRKHACATCPMRSQALEEMRALLK